MIKIRSYDKYSKIYSQTLQFTIHRKIIYLEYGIFNKMLTDILNINNNVINNNVNNILKLSFNA